MTRRIKILFTIPNFDTAGSGKVVYDLVNGLDKTIFDPEICCFHDRGDYFKTIETLGVKIHIFAFTTDYKPFVGFPYRVFKIYKFFKTHHFDLIHSWHWSSDFSEPLAAKLARIPFVYTKKAMGWGNKAWRYRSWLSTKIITINNDMQSFFSRVKHKVVNIPLGVDIGFFKPLERKGVVLEDCKINDNDFIIVSIANLVPVKGIEILIEAVRLLNNPRIKVFIVGNNENVYGRTLKSKYENSQFQFLGKKSDVRPYLAKANLFVIPTKDEGRKEGLPIAPLEAMASQRVVIGSNISGIKDILKPFPECLFKPDDINDLLNSIKLMFEMKTPERQKLEQAMFIHLHKNFGLKKCIISHEKLYKSILKY